MAFERLIELDRCHRGGGTFVSVRDLELAVFVMADTEEVVVSDNACPHANGNLSGGALSGHVVSCPWHDWKFDLHGGACTETPNAKIRIFQSTVRDGVVWVNIDPTGS